MLRSVGTWLLAGMLSASAAFAARGAEREALRQALQSVIRQSSLEPARISVLVKSLDDGAVVFSKAANELMNPASNVKLFTAATALTQLGLAYRFETEFLTPQDFSQGQARILYVRGKGDPTITTERLYAIVTELIHAGLREVRDIVVDDSWFDAVRKPPGYDQESGDKAYLAPTGALSLNWNTVAVHLRPAETTGKRGAIEVEPLSDYFVVHGRLATGRKTQRRFRVSSSSMRDDTRQHISVRGVVPVGKGTWTVWRRISQPHLYFGFTLKKLLQQNGVKVRGRVRAGKIPEAHKTLYVASSDTLDIVLKKMNKYSSNFIAEQLLKTLAAERYGPPGSTSQGLEVVETYLAQEVGIPAGSFVMKNGSGLNDSNRFSAAHVTRLLTHMSKNFSLMPEYLSALGIAGTDGTLACRFEGSEAVGRLRAKTGTLQNVVALSGYAHALGGERFVFSMMVNDFNVRTSKVTRYIDAMGAAIAAYGTADGPGAAVASVTESDKHVVVPFAELRSHMATYMSLVRQGERKHLAFLRTAWHSERDPAVRAIIADALYQLEPRAPFAVHLLLESALATDDVYMRLRKAAEADGLDVPVVPSLVELAAAGNIEAFVRLFAFTRASLSDAKASAWLAEQLLVASLDAPKEFVSALKRTQLQDRTLVIDVFVEGLVRASQPQELLWTALREAQNPMDFSMVAFVKSLKDILSQKIAAATKPAPRPSDDESPAATQAPTNANETE